MTLYGRRILAFLLAAGLSACIARGMPRSDHASDQSVLTAGELQQSNQGNLYDAVRMLRPQWLTPRTRASQTTSDADIILYVDNQRMGTLDQLRSLSINAAASLRFYSPSAATARFGPGHANGVIQVVSASGT